MTGDGTRDGEVPAVDLDVTLRPPAGHEATIVAGGGATGGGPRSPEPEPLRRGAAIGRYLVLGRLGAGGMGVVYAAYDPELDRKVAIKILHREAGDDTTTAGRSRLQREAQAMARLSHPSVVAVHDVGSIDGRIFIAMEYIDGETLSAWLARVRPAWPEIVRVLREAGAGLLAAHEAGMVHRDFKPDNVLISREGRVKVSDFGLARSVEEAPAPDPGPRRDPGASLIEATRRLTGEVTSLTLPGSLLGTPSYMAPEQLLGQVADARSDLYAFSVSLYEALYGGLPHRGGTLGELMAHVLDEPPTPPPRGPVPAHFAAIVLRGLEKDPARRYPSMAALLADLEIDPRQRRRRRLLALGGAAAVLALAGGVYQQERAEERRCAAAAAGLEDAWSEPRIAAIRGAFTALDRPFAADSLEATLTLAGRHVGAWSRAAGEVCEAHVRGDTSDEIHALQEACLGQQRARFVALVDLLGRADADVAARAIDAIAELPAPAACVDGDRVRVAFAGGAVDTAEVLRIRGEIDRGQALIATGRAREAAPIAAAAAEAARASGALPVIGAAELLHGQALALADDRGAIEGLHRALAAGIAAGDDTLAARAAIDLAGVLLDLEERGDDGRRWLDLADAWIAAEDEPVLTIDALRVRARIARRRGDADEARAHLGAALARARALGEQGPLAVKIAIEEAELRVDAVEVEALQRDAEALLGPIHGLYGADHPTYARALTALGQAALAADATDEAERRFREADAIVRRAFGARHRRVAESTMNLAQIPTHRGDHEGALALFQEAQAIFEGALGPAHSMVATAGNNVGNMLKNVERWDEAADAFARTVEIRRRSGVRGVYAPLMNLAMVRYEQAWNDRCDGDEARARERFAVAAAHARESLAEARRELAPDHLHIGVVRTSLGLILAAIGEDREGLAEFRAALAINEAALGPRSSQLAFALLGIGRTLHNLGRDAEAREPLERALALPHFAGDSELPQEIATELAMVLWELGDERERAIRLAREAHRYFTANGTPPACESAGAWLRERGVAP